ncbi:zeta toxin family protein [Bacteroides stercorirosoris]|jgi:predicted ABC-type ATPase|uniref:Zeta toxin n=1 Tax=Bacteroides stercorirosoris TaxID=871324 RepID=A0A413H730_9BACE|nr:zeta toxin family protein [Bacteroides stercorirosoris]OKZ09735.1 MAG: zeta toxin [Bacteroides oleiciplenus]RGX79376.1 zeta toxin [Bacteroides stercorirosoris]
MSSTKQLYIISGCNGAGKTTASYTVLPDVLQCKEFVNADEIARGLSPFNPSSMAIEAGRLMLQRIDELLKNQESFSIETTLATRSYIRLVTNAQKQGYKVSLIYFWLNSPQLAVSRVKQRVSNGGHDIPEDVIYRRYQAGINNLFDIYIPQVDYWLLADNSYTPRVIVAEGGRNQEMEIQDVELFNTIQDYVGR